MQDQSLYSQMNNPSFPEQEHLKCPRCDSPNTKFCYYNNYNLSQPRHYCKNCKRYWTKGGALRNIPVGGGTRKSSSKRSSTTKKPPSLSSPSSTTLPSSPSASSSITPTETRSLSSPNAPASNQGSKIFNALLAPVNEGQSSNLTNALSPRRPELRLGEFVTMQIPGSSSGSGSVEGRIEKKNSTTTSCWNSGNEWPHLAIFTPGSNFQ